VRLRGKHSSTPAPRLLDLFCGQGGTGVGYARSGFEVVGVDNDPKALLRYPGESYCMDWREGLEKFAGDVDMIHASPPCQFYSRMVLAENRSKHPDLVPDVRRALQEAGKPWVIENVPGAPLRHPTVLCGCMFDDLTAEWRGKIWGLRRKRLFETNWKLDQPWHKSHYLPSMPVVGHGHPIWWRKQHGSNCDVPVRVKRELMQCGWMTGAGVAEAVPPAYTEYIGRSFVGFHKIAAAALPQ
jgi:DNA (cytosine-5)-methyltransferase 1